LARVAAGQLARVAAGQLALVLAGQLARVAQQLAPDAARSGGGASPTE